MTWCLGCRKKYRKKGGYGIRASKPRRALRVIGTEPRFIFARNSGNKKLGGIPAVIVSPETCPPSCGFYGKGCFAEFGMLGHHWRNSAATGVSFEQLLERVRALPAGQLWRYAVAGDLPGQGDRLDIAMLAALVEANRGRRGFTFTHKPLTFRAERQAVAKANANGFTINLSCDNRDELKRKSRLQIAPTVIVLPSAGPAPEGVVECLAERFEDRTCANCRLCAIPTRASAVSFRAHGQMRATVSRIASGDSS